MMTLFLLSFFSLQEVFKKEALGEFMKETEMEEQYFCYEQEDNEPDDEFDISQEEE